MSSPGRHLKYFDANSIRREFTILGSYETLNESLELQSTPSPLYDDITCPTCAVNKVTIHRK